MNTPNRSRLAAVFLLGAALVAALAMSACGGDDDVSVEPTGVDETRSFSLSGFSEIEIRNAFRAEISQASSFSVSITVDRALLEHLDVRTSGNKLIIGLSSGLSLDGSMTMTASVTLPTVRAVTVSGASSVLLDDVSLDSSARLEASGASSLDGDIAAPSARIVLSGASSAELSGRVADLELEASGASRLALADLRVQTAVVDLSGASRADIAVSDTISRVRLSGASLLTYSGTPDLQDVETSGASAVERR